MQVRLWLVGIEVVLMREVVLDVIGLHVGMRFFLLLYTMARSGRQTDLLQLFSRLLNAWLMIENVLNRNFLLSRSSFKKI